jgi:hypothetical protein
VEEQSEETEAAKRELEQQRSRARLQGTAAGTRMVGRSSTRPSHIPGSTDEAGGEDSPNESKTE